MRYKGHRYRLGPDRNKIRRSHRKFRGRSFGAVRSWTSDSPEAQSSTGKTHWKQLYVIIKYQISSIKYQVSSFK
jgi:hypothetical protein